MNKTTESVVNCRNFCGEAPVWIHKDHQLYWVDTGRKECHRMNTMNNVHSTIPMDDLPQALGRTDSDGWICPMEKRVVLLNDSFQIVKDLGSPLSADSPLLIGDGTCGPDGCYYFGVYHPEDLTSKEGAVYKVNHNLTFEKIIPEMALPNGMAFNKEGNKFFLTEMFGNCIWTFDFNQESSEFSNKRLFTEIPEAEGYPDGLILDDEGGVWSAHWQGSRVTRYTPDGKVERIIKVPVPTATCMAFGSDDSLYITTAIKGCSEEQLKAYPDAGNLFRVKTDFRGYPEREFVELKS
jgi:sugar lactone lactonase YvrE